MAFAVKKQPFNLKHLARYDPEKAGPHGLEAVTQAITDAGSGVSDHVAMSPSEHAV